MIASLIVKLGPWAWIILGLLLAAVEMLAPGVFMIWLGLAAILTGIADGLLGLSWQASALVFAALAVACVLLGRHFTRQAGRGRNQPALPHRRGQALVGRVFTLDAPIERGVGRIKVNDSVWRVTGPDSPAGATVRVTAVDGATLVSARVGSWWRASGRIAKRVVSSEL
jgi:membrane protein implicated in regulation of membrane protease activity